MEYVFPILNNPSAPHIQSWSSEEEENKPFMDGCNSVMLKVGWYQEGGGDFEQFVVLIINLQSIDKCGIIAL